MAARSTKTRRDNGDGQRPLLDRELDHLPPEARWREWMQRVEATIFAASEPVTRSVLAREVGAEWGSRLRRSPAAAAVERGRPDIRRAPFASFLVNAFY